MSIQRWSLVAAFSVTACLTLTTACHADLHKELLDLAAQQQQQRRAVFAAVKTTDDLGDLQKELRRKFLGLLDGLPTPTGDPPPAKVTGTIEAEDYVVEKLVYESFPGYFVSALLYKPKKVTARLPGILSPCGHSAVGKAANTYQILHINLVKRGYVVLTYDPIGQGERSQFWDKDKGKSRFNLVCGEHAVLGNPLYLLGTNLARYRIWDGMRGIDYLASLPEVDPKRIGCVGNSGGGTLTAYIAALDERVKAAAICCYITTLPRRMGNRIEADPDADPEQDIFGFVGEGIDHAGLLALRAPRPTLVGAAEFDFFPIAGARESFAEAKKLYEAAGAGEQVQMVEAAEKHGLTLPLRKGVYFWFERWLGGRTLDKDAPEIAVQPRPAKELLACQEGQVNVSFNSRHLLPLALEQWEQTKPPPRLTLPKVLALDAEKGKEEFRVTELSSGAAGNQTMVLCLNGNESRGWQEETDFVAALKKRGYAVAVIDPRGVGALRPKLAVKGHDYADPLVGVEENLAYNAFLVGKSLVGMRVADTLAAVRKLAPADGKTRVVLCGRRDAALVACLAAAIEPAIQHVAVEEMPLTYKLFFDTAGQPINAAQIVPRMLRDFGDIGDVLAEIAPRRLLVAAGRGRNTRQVATLTLADAPFSRAPAVLLDWLR